MTAWLCLLLGLFEIIWAMTLKYSDGFTRLWPSLATAAAVALSFGFMAVSLKTLPFGTVYAVWEGSGGRHHGHRHAGLRRSHRRVARRLAASDPGRAGGPQARDAVLTAGYRARVR